MSLLSGKVRERLEALGIKFASELPGRIRELRSAVFTALANPTDPKSVETARSLAHKLAGSGSTFGFQDVSTTARKIENRIARLSSAEEVKEGDGVDTPDRKEVSELLDDLNAAAEKPEQSRKLSLPDSELMEEVAPGAEGYRARLVLLWLPDETTADDLYAQLGFFGFPVEKISGTDTIEQRLTGERQVIAIIDVSVVEQSTGCAQTLSGLKESHSDELSMMFVSGSDNFDVRLSAVRWGGDAFFAAPFEISGMIDATESLASRNEAPPYHVLIVDDDHDHVSYLALTLQKAGMVTSLATDPRRVFKILVEEKPEIILLDMYMPEANGVELAKVIRQQESYVGIPIVFISVETDPQKQFQAISQGGDDFISKPVDPIVLVNTVRIRAERTRRMRFFMERDSLTGLLNHSNLREKMSLELQRAERMENGMCFAMIDLDHFKWVNDTYGHLTGDRVLKSLAKLLQERLRRTDTIGRYGGEEFGVILFDTNAHNAERIMGELRDSFSRVHHLAGDREFYVTLSCGIASYPTYRTVNELTEAADAALYEAKESGRNVVVTAKG
ncbi:MAG: diguanylate cyclase [Spirochaetota bacterium]